MHAWYALSSGCFGSAHIGDMAGVAGRDIDHVELENTDAGGKGEEKLVSRSVHDDAFSNVWPAIKYIPNMSNCPCMIPIKSRTGVGIDASVLCGTVWLADCAIDATQCIRGSSLNDLEGLVPFSAQATP